MKKLIVSIVTAIGFMVGVPAHAELVTNGGFESGLSGWTCSGADLCSTTADSHSGMAAAFGFDNSGYAVLGQTIATSAGTTYDFSVFSKASVLSIGNEFGFSFSDFEHAIFVPVTTTYTQSLASFVATANSTLLSLYFATDPGTGTVLIDDVSITPRVGTVPEPTTVALLGLGLIGFAASRRKSAKAKNA